MTTTTINDGLNTETQKRETIWNSVKRHMYLHTHKKASFYILYVLKFSMIASPGLL